VRRVDDLELRPLVGNPENDAVISIVIGELAEYSESDELLIELARPDEIAGRASNTHGRRDLAGPGVVVAGHDASHSRGSVA